MTPEQAWDLVGVEVETRWYIFWRRDSKSRWVEYGSESSEHNGRGVVAHVRDEHPGYEVELRKRTTLTERVHGA